MANLRKYGRELIKEGLPEGIPLVYGLSSKLSTLVFGLRIRKNWSQNDLAVKLNVRPEIVHRLEGGSKEISIGLYEEALHVLDMSYDEMDELIKY